MKGFKISMVALSMSIALAGNVNITNDEGVEIVKSSSPSTESPTTEGGGSIPNSITGKNSIAVGEGNYLIGDKITVEGHKNTSTVDSSSIYGDRNTSSKLPKEVLAKRIQDIDDVKKLNKIDHDLKKIKETPISDDPPYRPFYHASPKPRIIRAPNISFDDSSFESTNDNYESWAQAHQDLIKSLKDMKRSEIYSGEDSSLHALLDKVLLERKIPKQELIEQLNSSDIINIYNSAKDDERIRYFVNIGPMQDFMTGDWTPTSGVNGHKLALYKNGDSYSSNPAEIESSSVIDLEPHLVLNKEMKDAYSWWDLKDDRWNLRQYGKSQFNWFSRVIDYHDVESTIDSDSVLNLPLSEYQKMRDYYDFVDWDREDTVFEKESMNQLKHKLAKNIELYESIASISELRAKGGSQEKINELITKVKGILADNNNLFKEKLKYRLNKENYLKSVDKLIEYKRSIGEPVEEFDKDYIARQLDEDPTREFIHSSARYENKKKELEDKKAQQIAELKNQQLQLLQGLDLENKEEYKTAIKNESLTEEQIQELNKKITESTRGNLANTIVGHKNFNAGNKSHILGAENTVMSEGSSVIGNNNNLLKEATNTFVLGSNVSTNVPNSVALGHDTVLSAPVATISHTIAGTQYNFAGTAPVGTVSIGAEGKERTLTNLAAGRISNTSTDGINGSQLNAVIETLNSLNTELTTLKNAPKGGKTVIKAGDGLSLTEGEDGSITLSNALNFNAGNGIGVNKEGNNITIANTQPLSTEDKTKYDNASTKAETAVQPDKLKAGDGISVSKSDNGEITITNTKAFETADKEKLNTAFDKSNTAIQPDALEAGNGISINKTDGKITITNTQPLSNENKTKYDNASTTANNALEKANTNEGAINTANGRITANEGKITTNEGKISTQEGKINDLTPRVTANEGNITTLTGKVTTVTNTANEALGKANTNAETINNVSGIANEALGKANTAVQPEMLESGEGIAINKKDGKVIISSTVNNNGGNGQATNLIAGNGISIQPNEDKTSTVITNTQAFTDVDREKLNSALQPNDLKAGSGITIENNTISNALSFEGESGIEVNREGDKVTIKGKPIVVNSLSVKTDQGEEKVKEKLEITGSDNIETETKNGKVVVKTKPVIKAKTLIADEMNIGGTVINSKQVNMGNKVVDGVANGEISEHSQQAINGSQIFPIVNQVNVNTQEIHQLNGRVGNIEQRIGKMSKRYEAGLAGVAAMAGVPQVMGAGKRSLGVGVGTRPGANAVAVGYSASSDNGHHIIKTSFAVDTQRKLTGNAGYSYQW